MSGRPRAWRVSGLVLALACVVGTAGPAWGSGVSATTAPNLAPQLLTISQMPTGWSVNTSSPNTSCLTAPLDAVAGEARASFNGSGGVPVLSERLVPGGASEYASVKKSLDGVPNFHVLQ